MAPRVKATWVKSGNCTLKRHRKTLKALGFKKLNSTVEHELTPAVAGMFEQVKYLITLEEVKK